MSKSITYILDPDDPRLQKQIDDADIALSHEKGYIITTDLDRGVVEHTIISEDIEQISQIVNSLNYVPVTTSLNKTTIPNNISIDKFMLGIYLEGIKEILKVLANKLLYVDIEFIEIIELKESYNFNLGVFENNDYLINFIKLSNPDVYFGYTLLNENQLVRYILEKWYESGDYVPQDINVKYLTVNGEDIAIIPIGSDTYEQDNTNKIINRMDSYINSLVKQGYFTYSFGIHDLEDLQYVKELCYMWNINIIYETDLSLLVLQTDVDFSITPKKWLQEALQKVKIGSFPFFNITGEWQYSYNDEYVRFYGSLYQDVVVKYATYLSYADLSDIYPIIKPFTVLTNINEDLSIKVALPTYELVIELSNRIMDALKKGISGVDKEFGGVWLTQSCDSLYDGIIKRWLVQSIDDSAYPMIFTSKYGEETLIYRSKLAIKYPSPFIFNEKNINETEEDLRIKLRKHYGHQICHDNLEPVLLETISDMSLKDLLKIIPTHENNNVTHCFSSDTLSQLNNFINPLTRQPFSEKVVKRLELLEWGWRGLYDVGVLYGLYQEVPTKILIPTTVGLIDMFRINTSQKKRELVGNLYLIQVEFEDGTTSPLFEISFPTVGLSIIDNVRTYIEELWERGYFLSYWDSAIQKFYIKKHPNIKSYNVTVTDEILLHAGDSIFDGNKAIELLESIK